ncbi:hypothetical protein WICMUC_002255 [Wickerhamomyces mucosus]|uniref:Uncharacterized protein n=1 Tax=Wickerhamomyces mucosus TaxID=1378264 RepID=A0A9P8PRF3_9ASCO|nr:hypothetical protein WICMUC_002255 [Wickerhamomyces mucosus]
MILFQCLLKELERITSFLKILTTTTSVSEDINFVITPNSIFIQILNLSNTVFNLINFKRQFFQDYKFELKDENTVNHGSFGKCLPITLQFQNLKKLSLINLEGLKNLQLIITELGIKFQFNFINGIEKIIVINSYEVINLNYENYYQLFKAIPLNEDDINYLQFEYINFKFLENLSNNLINLNDFEMIINDKFIKLKSFKRILKDDLNQSISNSINFKINTLKNFKILTPNQSIKITIKLKEFKILLNLIKLLKIDFKFYFLDDVNEIFIRFSYRNLIEFDSLFISFNEHVDNRLDQGVIVPIPTTDIRRNEEEEQEEATIEQRTTTAVEQQQPGLKSQNLFHETQDESDTDSGDEPINTISNTEQLINKGKDNSSIGPEISWNDEVQLLKIQSEREIINSAKSKYLTQFKKRKLIDNRNNQDEDNELLGPTQGIPTTKGLFE